MKRALAFACVALAACGSSSGAKKSDTNVVAVAKAAGSAPGASAGPPCDSTRGAPLDAEKAEGTRIVELCITGASADTTAALKKVLRLGADKTFTADALRHDLEVAYATGLVDQIEATARSAGTGSTLFLAVNERPRITGVTFEGVNVLKDHPLVAAFPKPGSTLEPAIVHATEKKLREEYANRGWNDAKVDHQIVPDGPNGVRVKLVVTEGNRAKIGKVTFPGAHGGREVGLRKAVELDEGAPFSEEKMKRAGLLAAVFYYDNGFLNVKVEDPKATRAADGTTAIAFAITEGPSFRVGKLGAKNVDAATEKDILSVVKTKPGEIFSRKKVAADMEAIAERTKKNGKPMTCEPETHLDTKAGVVDIVFAMREAR